MSEQPIPQEERRNLQIRQQNINKSLYSQQDLLISLKRNEYDICAIQEPYTDHNSMTRANFHWFTVYPSTHTSNPKATRSVILVNTNLLTNDWKQISIPHSDITAIEISHTYGTFTTTVTTMRPSNTYPIIWQQTRQHEPSPHPSTTYG